MNTNNPLELEKDLENMPQTDIPLQEPAAQLPVDGLEEETVAISDQEFEKALQEILAEEPGEVPPQEPETASPEVPAEKPEGKKKKSLSPKKILLMVAAGLLVLVIAAVAAGVAVYNSILNEIPRVEYVMNTVSQVELQEIEQYRPEDYLDTSDLEELKAAAKEHEEHVPSADDVLNILLIGQAAREGEAHRMADTMILLSVNKNTKTLTMTSFLRDSFVKLPDYRDLSGRYHDCGMQKLTVCYHLGYTFGGTADAMRMVNQCLYENFGVEVDYNVEVGFEGVIQIVDYMGGLEFDLTKAEAQYLDNDKNYPFPFKITEGKRVLDGAGTLAYARMRKANGDGESDIKRTSRQRLVLQKMLDQVRVLDPISLGGVVKDFLPYITTDMTNADLTKCMEEILPILTQLKVETGTCPAPGTYTGELIDMDGQPASILRFNMSENKKLMRRITEGETE